MSIVELSWRGQNDCTCTLELLRARAIGEADTVHSIQCSMLHACKYNKSFSNTNCSRVIHILALVGTLQSTVAWPPVQSECAACYHHL